MILGFKTEIDGQPTGFVPKILTHLGEEAMAAFLKKETLKQAVKLNIDLSNEPVDAAMKYYGKELIACDFVPKKLTIRDDPNNRWKPGMKIHFATGVRTKGYECFAVGECKGIGFITFDWHAASVLTKNQIKPKDKFFPVQEIGCKGLTEFAIWKAPYTDKISRDYVRLQKDMHYASLVDGFKLLTYEAVLTLAKDDGFESVDDFVNYHSSSNSWSRTFTKKIIYF